MTDEELDAFIEKARNAVKAKIAIAQEQFGLGTYARFDYNMETQEIRFSDDSGAVKVVARIVPIGSYSTATQSWLWAFENESIPKADDGLATAMQKITDETGLDAFANGFSPCDEALAWSLASVAAESLQAQAVYREASGQSLFFLALMDIRKA